MKILINGCTAEVWEWMSNFISRLDRSYDHLSMLDWSWSVFAKETPSIGRWKQSCSRFSDFLWLFYDFKYIFAEQTILFKIGRRNLAQLLGVLRVNLRPSVAWSIYASVMDAILYGSVRHQAIIRTNEGSLLTGIFQKMISVKNEVGIVKWTLVRACGLRSG